MTYSFKEAVAREFVLQVKAQQDINKLDIPQIIEGMQKEVAKTIIQYVNAKVMK